MDERTPEVAAARSVTERASAALRRAPSFAHLPTATQQALLSDLDRIGSALSPSGDPYALTLETPDDFHQHRFGGGVAPQAGAPAPAPAAPAAPAPAAPPGPQTAATATLAARTGALADEINFPAFVASLVHGTFDAIVDATIRQMEAFAELVSAVAKDVDDFTRDNVTPNQTRDWLVQRYPKDLELDPDSLRAGDPKLRRRAQPQSQDGEDDSASPSWLGDFGMDGTELTDETVEQDLVPAARHRVGENRLQTLATLVLLGMNRVVVRDGTVSARVRFRAAATDQAQVQYAVGNEPPTWGDRGSAMYSDHAMLVSTVGVNVQADTDLKAELFGQVEINFVSETLPLDRFVDSAKLALLQRHSRTAANQPAAAASPSTPAALPAATTPASAGLAGPAPATATPALAAPAPTPPAPAAPAPAVPNEPRR